MNRVGFMMVNPMWFTNSKNSVNRCKSARRARDGTSRQVSKKPTKQYVRKNKLFYAKQTQFVPFLAQKQ